MIDTCTDVMVFGDGRGRGRGAGTSDHGRFRMHDKSEMLSSGGRGTGRDTQVSTHSAYLGPVDALQRDTEHVSWSAHTPLPDSCSVTLSMHSWSAHITLTRLLQCDTKHALLVSTHSTYPGPVDALKRDAEHVLLVSVHLDPVALRAAPACQGHKQSLGHNYGGLLASEESICYYVHVVATVCSSLLIICA